jgi:hypothetical protein
VILIFGTKLPLRHFLKFEEAVLAVV